MQAVDTNILIHAEVASSQQHDPALKVLKGLAEGALPWGNPLALHLRVSASCHSSPVFHPPVPLKIALEDLRKLLASPSLFLLAETPRHLSVMDQVVSQSGATGNLVHDAHIVALCLEHGVSEIITGDRDFSRFAGLRIINPFTSH